jgi:hypothetical protein
MYGLVLAAGKMLGAEKQPVPTQDGGSPVPTQDGGSPAARNHYGLGVADAKSGKV